MIKRLHSSTHYRVAINLSVKQLQQKHIVSKLTEILKTNQCSPEWIELEVTEGYVMKNPEMAINTLQHFSNMGVEIAIDDFGTGYSSLSYLKRLPINKLKIDQSFVRDLSVDEDDKAIVESIIYLSKAMNLNVIAEGVETVAQKEFLQEYGCNEIQGYLYSKPVSADDMTTLLASKFIYI
jgi:EAL domain-containing protein (putative c-di-GMP-specific phosphodiesterase class I)